MERASVLKADISQKGYQGLNSCHGVELEESMKVNVLGTKYRIIKRPEDEDERLKNCDGYCDSSTKSIVVAIYKDDVMNKGDMKHYEKQLLRHEIVHAFFYESGLEANTSQCDEGWAQHEEMIDWIALQAPKLMRAFKEAGAI